MYSRIALQVARLMPETEESIMEALIERLCQLDVDIKVKPRRFAFSRADKMQSFS
jgi:hypothetical protein